MSFLFDILYRFTPIEQPLTMSIKTINGYTFNKEVVSLASTDKAISELSKVFEDGDISLITSNYSVVDSDEFIKSPKNCKEGEAVHVIGSGKRLDIARRKAELSDVSKIYQLEFVDVGEIEIFYGIKLSQLKGEAPADTSLDEDTEDDTGDADEPPVDSMEPVDGSNLTEEPTEVNLDKHEEEEEKPPETTTQVGGGLCQFGVPYLTVEYIPPSVMGLKESLTEDVSSDDLAEFFDKVKTRVLKKVGGS